MERTAFAFGYVRVSSHKQNIEGLSKEAQEQKIKDYFDWVKKDKYGHVEFGGVYVDGGISAFKKPIAERAAGRKLLDRLQSGDHIIMTRQDRAFRSVTDASKTIADWVKRGITLHLLDTRVDTSLSSGRLMFHMLAAFSEYEAEAARERTAATLAYRKKRDANAPVNQHVGYGSKLTGMRGHRRVVVDDNERTVMQVIVTLKDTDGMAFKDIYFHFVKQGIKTRGGKEWSVSRIQRAYHAAKRSTN